MPHKVSPERAPLRGTNSSRLDGRAPQRRHRDPERYQPNKLTYDPKAGTMRLSKVLPLGMVFPFDFGFVPSTLGDDGDPVDVLVLMDAPGARRLPRCCHDLSACCAVRSGRTAERSPSRTTDSSPSQKRPPPTVTSGDIRDLNGPLLDQIEAFFIQYNALGGPSVSKVHRRQGAKAAKRAVDAARVSRGPIAASS